MNVKFEGMYVSYSYKGKRTFEHNCKHKNSYLEIDERDL